MQQNPQDGAYPPPQPPPYQPGPGYGPPPPQHGHAPHPGYGYAPPPPQQQQQQQQQVVVVQQQSNVVTVKEDRGCLPDTTNWVWWNWLLAVLAVIFLGPIILAVAAMFRTFRYELDRSDYAG